MSRLVFALMWLVHWLPMGAIAAVGNLAGAAAYWLIPERRKVTRINLAKCFPEMSPPERERLARAHFRAFMRSFVEHALLWWAPRERIMRFVRLEGLEHLRALARVSAASAACCALAAACAAAVTFWRCTGVIAARLLFEMAMNRLSTKWLVSTICLVTS